MDMQHHLILEFYLTLKFGGNVKTIMSGKQKSLIEQKLLLEIKKVIVLNVKAEF